jgi:hypothetical protein
MAGPLWSMHGADIVYLMAKADFEGKVGWAIAFNTTKSTLDSVTSFQAKRYDFFQTCIPALCAIQIDFFRYLKRNRELVMQLDIATESL